MRGHETRIVDVALKSGIPSGYDSQEAVEAGGLMSYADAIVDRNRRAAASVDKLRKGATPADLPVEQPMTFELVINLKTAETLGLTIPPTLLFQATAGLRGAATPGTSRREAFCRCNRPALVTTSLTLVGSELDRVWEPAV
jgi:hypothetical protein